MLMRLFAPQFLVLWAFIASALAVHFRGKVRLGFWRQVSDHSTIMAPYNVLMYMFSAVPNRPVLQVGMIPELSVLRDNWQTIREEAQRLFAQGQIKAADKYNDWGFNSFFRTGWKRFYLKWYSAPLPSALANCPKTVELLNSIPNLRARCSRTSRRAASWCSTAIPMPARCAITSASWCRNRRANAASSSTAMPIPGATVKICCSTRPICTTPKTPPATTASSCSATSSVR
jgi:hypothetical protein